MRNASAQFFAAISGSHHMASRARVLTTPGQTGVNPGPLDSNNRPTTTIPIVSGAVTFDDSAQIQGSLDLTTTQPWPASATDLLTPYGNEIYVERGVVYGGGSTEWVGLGYYRIDDVDQQGAPDGTIEITGSDRMATIIDAQYPSPVTYTAGTAVHDVIVAAVQGAFTWTVTFVIDASLSTQYLNADQVTTSDRYGFLDSIMESYGMIMYWDYQGRFVVKPVPTLNSPVWTIKAGANGTLVSMARELSRTGIYNAAVVTGQQASDNSVPFAIVVDGNTGSPTYWYGQFGQVPQFISSSLYTSDAQCQVAAEAALTKTLGLPYEVDFGMIPNPALELYDPVTVQYNSGVTEHHIIDQMVIGLQASDAMTSQTRQMLSGNFLVIAGSGLSDAL